jgi:hypothetical protein
MQRVLLLLIECLLIVGVTNARLSGTRELCPTGAKFTQAEVFARHKAHYVSSRGVRAGAIIGGIYDVEPLTRSTPPKTNNKTQASIVRRFGAESAPAKAFIPSHELAAAVAQAATLPKAGAPAPAAAVPTPAELEALTAWVLGESEDANGGGTNGRRRLQQPSAATQTVNTYVHVIDGGPGTFSNVDQSVVDAQIAVLNTAYQPYGFAFVLANTSRTLAPEWTGIDIYSQAGDAAQLAMKTALRRGTAADLNLYVSDIKFGILGYSTFPDGYAELPLDDGVVLGWAYLPGADTDTGNIYNLGDTAFTRSAIGWDSTTLFRASARSTPSLAATWSPTRRRRRSPTTLRASSTGTRARASAIPARTP